MHTVRVRQQPDRRVDVDDAEYLDLQRQGLLVDEQPDEHAGQAGPAANTTQED